MDARKNSPHTQIGFSMIEVLVAIVVLSFGMLGVVGLQLQALRGNQHAALTAVASSLVRDYQETLTALPSTSASSATTTSKITSITKNSYTAYGSAKDCKLSANTCSPSEFADDATLEWIERVKSALPNGMVTICFDNAYVEATGSSKGLYKWACSSTGDMIVVKLGWSMRLKRDKSGNVLEEKGLDDGTDETARPRMVIPLTGNQEGYTL